MIDADLPAGRYAQTALADLDNDRHLEYIVGQQYGDIFWYKMHTPDRWTRHLLGSDSPSDVGGVALDVDGKGAEWRTSSSMPTSAGTRWLWAT